MSKSGGGGRGGGGKAEDITDKTNRDRSQSPTYLLQEMTRKAPESSRGTSTKNEGVPGTENPQEASEAEDDVRTTQARPTRSHQMEGRPGKPGTDSPFCFASTVRIGIPTRQSSRGGIVDPLRCGVERRAVIQQKQRYHYYNDKRCTEVTPKDIAPSQESIKLYTSCIFGSDINQNSDLHGCKNTW